MFIQTSTQTNARTHMSTEFSPENLFYRWIWVCQRKNPSQKLFTHDNPAAYHYGTLKASCSTDTPSRCNDLFWDIMPFRVNWHMNKSHRETFQLDFKCMQMIMLTVCFGAHVLVCLCSKIMVWARNGMNRGKKLPVIMSSWLHSAHTHPHVVGGFKLGTHEPNRTLNLKTIRILHQFSFRRLFLICIFHGIFLRLSPKPFSNRWMCMAENYGKWKRVANL